MLDLSPHSFVSEVVTNDSHHPRQGSVQAKGRACVCALERTCRSEAKALPLYLLILILIQWLIPRKLHT